MLIKKVAIYSRPEGGTREQELPADMQTRQALSDEQILELAGIGKTIERHFGPPQDIEWCFADGEFYIVQSRPITTLYPLPDLPDDRPRVFISFGHQQMMIDPIKPLGMSIFKNLGSLFWGTVEVGGRLFGDISGSLASRMGRKMAASMGKTDLLMSSAITEIANRREFIQKIKPEGKQSSYYGQ